MVRDYIVPNGKELEAIIKDPEFQKYFQGYVLLSSKERH